MNWDSHDLYSTPQEELSSCLSSATGTPAICTSPDFKSAAANFAATTGTLPTPMSADFQSASTNEQTIEQEDYSDIALSGEFVIPPLTSHPVTDSHLLSRGISASQQRMFPPLVSKLQLAQVKGVCRSELCINRADPLDIQIAQFQPKTPSFDDVYVNHQLETYLNLPAQIKKVNSR